MHNPYAVPSALLEDRPDTDVSAAESQRRALIRHEVQLKSVGALFYLGGFGLLLALIAVIPAGLGSAGADLWGVAIIAMLVVLGGLYFALGYGFRRLQPWVRIPGGVLTALGLLSFPVGTLIGAYVLFLMFGDKGRQVLAPAYQDVIAATPHVRYERSTGDWIALGLVVLLLVGVAGMILMAVLGGA